MPPLYNMKSGGMATALQSMKRALFACLIVLAASPALAFRTTLRRGDRVAVLRPQLRDDYRGAESVARTVCHYLQRELRSRGLDAFDARLTYDDVVRDGRTDADYYVEVVSSDAAAAPVGGVGIGNRNVGVDVAVVISRVAATLRLYDGRTLELIDTLDLRRNSSALMPTAIGIGGDRVSLWLAIPFVQYSRYRAAARAVAQDAAEQIASVRK